MGSSIAAIHLHYPNGASSNAMTHECDRAIADLCETAVFRATAESAAPYSIDLSIQNRQLVFAVADADGMALPQMILSLSPYRAIIRDYFMMIESYEQMRLAGQQAKLEPTDMARRGLHNEAADLMIERLKDKIVMDHDTARRFFTLICALHMGTTRF